MNKGKGCCSGSTRADVQPRSLKTQRGISGRSSRYYYQITAGYKRRRTCDKQLGWSMRPYSCRDALLSAFHRQTFCSWRAAKVPSTRQSILLDCTSVNTDHTLSYACSQECAREHTSKRTWHIWIVPYHATKKITESDCIYGSTGK